MTTSDQWSNRREETGGQTDSCAVSGIGAAAPVQISILIWWEGTFHCIGKYFSEVQGPPEFWHCDNGGDTGHWDVGVTLPQCTMGKQWLQTHRWHPDSHTAALLIIITQWTDQGVRSRTSHHCPWGLVSKTPIQAQGGPQEITEMGNWI